MYVTTSMDWFFENPNRETRMTTHSSDEIPFMQRLYNRIWLLAALALAFFLAVYVVWGVVDIFSVPVG